jgi:hypothetical protein
MRPKNSSCRQSGPTALPELPSDLGSNDHETSQFYPKLRRNLNNQYSESAKSDTSSVYRPGVFWYRVREELIKNGAEKWGNLGMMG